MGGLKDAPKCTEQMILFRRLALNYVAAATPAHGFWSTPYSQFSPASSTRTVVKVNHLEKYKIAA